MAKKTALKEAAKLPTQNPLGKIVVLGREYAPHKDVYHLVLRAPWWAFFGTAALVFILTNAFFAGLYSLSAGCIDHVYTYEDAFFFSVQTLGTIGYGGMSPSTRYGHTVVSFEAFTGIIMTALVTGLTFAKFARPTARVLFAKHCVIYPRNGIPNLVFRVANFRANTVIEATLRVTVLVVETTEEGEVLRRSIDLKLVKSSTPLFQLTWNAMHVIDETSPFYGPNALEKLRAQKAELFLSFSGLDETIAAEIHARYRYSLDDILLNVRHADILTIEDGVRTLDYSVFHDMIPVEKKPDASPAETKSNSSDDKA